MNIIKHIPSRWLLYAVLSLVVVGCSDTSQEAKQGASTEDVGDGDGDAGSSDITEGVADADGGGVGDTSPEDGGGEPDDTGNANEDVAEDVVEDVRDSSSEDIPPDAFEGDAALEDAMGDTGGGVEDTEIGREDAAGDTEADMTDEEGCGECAENASCVGGVCVCDEGYEGDGSLCEQVPVCVCDQWIASDARTFDASDVAPGTTLCLRPGTRNMLLISNVSGREGAPVVIASCEGSVHINAPTTGNVGLSVSGDHWRLTGAGLEGVERSIRVSAPEASRAVSVGRATHYEIDHIEIDASGFAGIMAKVDPGRSDCRDNDRRFDPYVMQGVSIHHNYIHDVDGEGIYLGNSFYGGNFSSYCGNNENCDWSACDAQWPVRLQYPHPVRGVRVFANLIEDTGWDGIQVGSADDDCTIEGNVVRRWGQDAPGAHQNGIQVGDGSSCDVLSNRLEVGPNGMHLAGIGEVLVANNVLVGIGQFGMNPNPRPPCGDDDAQNTCDDWIRPYPFVEGFDLRGGMLIANNTIVMAPSGTYPVRRFGNRNYPLEELYNNIIIFDQENWQRDRLGGWVIDDNLHFREANAAGFVDANGLDFRLMDTAEGVDSGRDLSDRGVLEDIDGNRRPAGDGFDVGAYERP